MLKILHENEVVQLRDNYKYYGVEQSYFRKPLKSSATDVKNNYCKIIRSFLLAV